LGQQVTTATKLPPLDDEGHLVLTLETILETQERTLRNRGIKEHLVKWKDFPDEKFEYISRELEIVGGGAHMRKGINKYK